MPSATFDPEVLMRRALRLARRGLGRVEPNPMVGCVLVKDGRIVGEGWHRRFGGPHAEVYALRQAGQAAEGATAYVTLEPCSYHGKTPPCADALIRAGVREVVASTMDPNPRVNGAGLRRLRRAGVKATAGLLEREGRELIAPFRKRITTGRPYVTGKWAQSLDGRLAAADGTSKWISGEAARREAHALRARVDAILVGVGTVLKDDPMLTARGGRVRRRAARVVLDSRLRTPTTSRLIRSIAEGPVILMTTTDAARSARAAALRRRGVEVVGVARSGRRPGVRSVLRELGRREMTNVLVEGGARVLAAMLAAHELDEAWVYVRPMLIGGRDAPQIGDGLNLRTLRSAMRAADVGVRRIGPDVCFQLRFRKP
ncbi:MAG: riboflavin biosynthesis protein RibD [Planctomycetota bacterium]|nr:MAG: riboflavin biosynthesis protein RibD [Planctomycetota bacterium]